jgi:hypothetical protein
MPGEDRPKPARRFAATPKLRVGSGARRPAAPGSGPRRPADRHYIAVVAAEARRLARQLRPPMPPLPVRPEGSH